MATEKYKTSYLFELMPRDWYKRRTPNRPEPEPVEIVSVVPFDKVHNLMCTMTVRYSNGTEKQLLSRVLYNKLQDHWAVDAMSVAAKLIEE